MSEELKEKQLIRNATRLRQYLTQNFNNPHSPDFEEMKELQGMCKDVLDLILGKEK